MTTRTDRNRPANRNAMPRNWARFASILVVAIALLNLGLGWGAGLNFFTRVMPSLPAMVPGTAVCAALLASGQILRLSESSWSRRSGTALIAVTPIFAFVQYWFGAISNPVSAGATDRMSTATFAGFLIVAVGQCAADYLRGWDRNLHVVLAGTGCFLALIGVSGYIINVGELEQYTVFRGLSLLTAVVLFLLNAAVLLSRPEHGIAALMMSDKPGGEMARRFMPAAIILPVVLCLIADWTTDIGWITSNVRLSALALVLVALSSVFVLRMAGALDDRALLTDQANMRLRDILSGLDVAIFVIERDGHRLTLNKRAEAMIGPKKPEHWLKQSAFHAVQDRRPLHGAEHPVKQVLDHGREIFAGWIDLDGAEKVLRLAAFETGRTGGRTNLRVLAIYDVTEPWLLRENMARSERLEAVGQLASGVAHEMSNIFGVIKLSIGSVELSDPTVAPTQFRAIMNACRRGGALADRMQKLTIEDASGGETTEAISALSAAIELVRKAVPSDIDFDVDLPSAPLTIDCDPIDLEMALVNLVLNARNAMVEAGKSEGTIRLRVAQEPEWLTLSVSDNGPGMDTELLKRITEPFFTTRRATGGTGLGLAIIDTFARRHGGMFQITSTPNIGTLAKLRLPLRGSSGSAAHEDMPSAVTLAGLKILVVEDDLQFKGVLGDTLTALGATVDRAESADSAMSLIRSAGPFDVLLTDYQLVGPEDGHELAKRAIAYQPRLPVVYLTGMSGVQIDEPPIPGLILRKPVHLGLLTYTIRLAFDTQLAGTRGGDA